MTGPAPLSRRALLRVSALAAAGVAGCATDAPETDAGDGADSAPSPTDAPGESSMPSPSPTPTDAGGGATPAATASEQPDLDLREANVTAVEFEERDGSYRFSVTLYHDDDGEDGYANWWQVESLDGEQLGRRELLHSHSTAPFTRSEPVEIPDGTTCVVVRGHDQTHEYGGRAVLVDLDSSATRGVTQGSEARSFDTGDCP